MFSLPATAGDVNCSPLFARDLGKSLKADRGHPIGAAHQADDRLEIGCASLEGMLLIGHKGKAPGAAVFRGVFQRLFSELFKNIHWGIIVSAALFSAMHMQFYGFIPRMLLGVIFGYLLIWSGSLWIPIAAHFVNNAFGVIYYYLYYNGTVGNGLQTEGTGSNDQLLVIVSIVCLVILLVLFFRYQKKTVHSSDIIS